MIMRHVARSRPASRRLRWGESSFAMRRFADIASRLPIDEAVYRRHLRELAPARRHYLIIFTGRSGSSWLAGLLAATGRLGRPDEYFNPGLIEGAARDLHAGSASAYLAMLVRACRTANGVFGAKLRHTDAELFGEAEIFASLLPDAVIFLLWRENIIAQGISLFRAMGSARFHGADAAEAPPPPYDAAAIARCVAQVLHTEHGNLRMLARQGRRFAALRYEALRADPLAHIRAIATVLDVPLSVEEAQAAIAASPHIRLADDWSRAAEARFRQEESQAVAAILAARQMPHVAQDNPG